MSAGRRAAAACLFSATVAAAAELSEPEQSGRSIYRNGASRSGAEIVALVGEQRTEIPASVLPCGSCHGEDGRGLPQPGLTAADITWKALTEPRGPVAKGPQATHRRPRPAYTEELLVRAITRGVDSAGQRLHISMPRYRLTRRDAAALIAYLRRLGTEPAAAEKPAKATLAPENAAQQ